MGSALLQMPHALELRTVLLGDSCPWLQSLDWENHAMGQLRLASLQWRLPNLWETHFFHFFFTLSNGRAVGCSQVGSISFPYYNPPWNLLSLFSQAQRDDPEFLSICSLRNETLKPQTLSGWTPLSLTGLPKGIYLFSPFLVGERKSTLFLAQLLTSEDFLLNFFCSFASVS